MHLEQKVKPDLDFLLLKCFWGSILKSYPKLNQVILPTWLKVYYTMIYSSTSTYLLSSIFWSAFLSLCYKMTYTAWCLPPTFFTQCIHFKSIFHLSSKGFGLYSRSLNWMGLNLKPCLSVKESILLTLQFSINWALKAAVLLSLWSSLPDMSDVWEQHKKMGEAGVLLAEGEATFGDGPHQSIGYCIQETQQLGTTLRLLAALRWAQAHIWWHK